MLHPALAQALATAHIEDLHRAAARRRAIRFARPVAHQPHPYPRTVENPPLLPEVVLDTDVQDNSLDLDGTTFSWRKRQPTPHGRAHSGAAQTRGDAPHGCADVM